MQPTDFKVILLLFCFVVALAKVKNGPRWMLWLTLQLGIASVVEVVGLGFKWQGLNNHLLFNVYLLIDFFSLLLLLISLPRKTKWFWGAAAIGSVAFLTVFVQQVAGPDGFHHFAAAAVVVGGFVLAVCCLFLLFQVVRTQYVALHRQPTFWVLAGILLYYLCSTPLFGLLWYILALDEENVLAIRLYEINSVLFVIRYGAITVGLFLLRRHSKLKLTQ